MGSNNSRENRIKNCDTKGRGSKNVVIFGETGVGKSSVINMLLGSKVAEVSSAAIGCTFEYSLVPYEDYVFYDTVGLNEGRAGTVENKKSTSMLINLLKSLEGGVNLLVMVMKMGRITETIHNNYKLFVEIMTRNKVPLILVVTNCEELLNMNEWWVDNKEAFTDVHNMKIADCICVCSSDGQGEDIDPSIAEAMKKRYDESGAKLMDLIDKSVIEHGWRHDDFFNWVVVVLKSFINFISLRETVSYWPELTTWLRKSLHLTNKEAKKMSNDIFAGYESEDRCDVE